MLCYIQFFLFLYNLSSLLSKLTKFHSIFSDDYEKKIHPFYSTPICVVHNSRPSNKIFVVCLC